MKCIKVVASLILSVCMMVFLTFSAQGADAYIKGTSSAREGDTIKIEIGISAKGQYGMEGTLSYDDTKVSLTKVTSSKKGWKVERNGKVLVAYDDALSSPTSGKNSIITATFKIKDNVKANEVIKISVNGLVVSDGNNEKNCGTLSHSIKILPPLSGNNYIQGITIHNASQLSNFQKDKLNYDIGEVDYDVKKLDFTVSLSDKNSSFSVKGDNLTVGKNVVKINVKAENGNVRTYTITVTRKQDPNYVASSNGNIKELSVTGGTVSPAFNPEVKEYIVYLPYEKVGKTFEANGVAQDSKAKGVKNGKIDSLKEGANDTELICTAEDGTTNTYKITVYVMPEYVGEIPVIESEAEKAPTKTPKPVETPKPETTIKPQNTTAPQTTMKPETTTKPGSEATSNQKENEGENVEQSKNLEDEKNGKNSLIFELALVFLGGIVIGVLMCNFVSKYIEKKKS